MLYHQTIHSSKAFYSNMLDDWCEDYYTQNYNRYSYAFNNPLKYIDPSGYNNIRLDENTTAVPYIAGSSGYLNNWNYITSGIGPGSGNHWSDQNRSEWGNFMLGNSRFFDGMYGQGAWNNF